MSHLSVFIDLMDLPCVLEFKVQYLHIKVFLLNKV